MKHAFLVVGRIALVVIALAVPGAPASAGVPGDGASSINAEGWQEISVGVDYACAVRDSRALACWGHNATGQLGQGDLIDRHLPADVEGGGLWQQVSAGDYHTCAIRDEGSLWCWGRNYGGELGLGDQDQRLVPTHVGSWRWVQVSAGEDHTCAVRSDHSLWCWGSNYFGQVGDGTEVNRWTPRRIGPNHDWQSVSAGGGHTCGIRADGLLKCWGGNEAGELGVGDEARRHAPTRVRGRGQWSEISTGSGHTCSVQTDGSAYCWGHGPYGQLGNSGHSDAHVPDRVVGRERNWSLSVAAMSHTCGLRGSGELWCFGGNGGGQLGRGERGKSLVPVRVVGDHVVWIAASVGGHNSCAIQQDRSLWCWGENKYGQVGDGSTRQRREPVEVQTS